MHDASTDRVRSALTHISPDTRDVWVRQGAAIKDEFGEAGFDLWDEWGSTGHGHNANAAKSTWKSFKKGGLGIGTVFYDAKQCGWKDDSKYERPSPAAVEARRVLRAERDAAIAAQEAILSAAAASHGLELWNNATPSDQHPYLERKGVKSHGVRVGNWEFIDGETGEVFQVPDCLLVPMLDRQKNLHSLQCIEANPKKPKRYLKDGAKQGHFYPIGKPLLESGKPVFVLAEGYATGASVHECTGHMVLICFDASNLLAVAKVIRERSPDGIIVFAADNDIWTEGNPGVRAATKAAEAVGGFVVPPAFSIADGASGGQPKDWNDWSVMHGGASLASAFGDLLSAALFPPLVVVPDSDPEPTLPDYDEIDEEDCDPSGYFTVLGYDRGRYYVLVHEQSQIHVLAGSMIGAEATMLMLAPLQWWEFNFPGDKGALDKKRFQNWFFRLAAKRGIYDIGRLRGRGAWVDDGRVVFHHGLNLSVDGETMGVTQIKSRYVYELARTLPLPAETALSDADGARLVDIARMFRWSKPGAAALLAGWTFLAPVCGALRWRPHVWLTGGAGTGKSTILNEYVNGLLGDLSVFAQGASTEAGIRQTLKADALPVLFDESEQNNDGEKRKMDGVLALIRQASTESQAKTLKGSISGDAMNFHIRSMFCLASIQVGMEHRADRDRLTQLTLLRPRDDGAGSDWEKIKDALYFITRDAGVSRRMLRRALDLLPIIHKNITVFIGAASTAFGNQRMGDQYGTLLAGCWSMASSVVATPEQAAAMIASYEWGEFLEPGEMDDSEKALRSIMEAKLSHKGEVFSVATVVDVAAGGSVEGMGIDQLTALRLMRDNGMTLSAGKILFQNDSTALRKLAGDTPFAIDLRGQLLRIPGAMKMEPRRFAGGTLSRSIGLPLASILGENDQPPI